MDKKIGPKYDVWGKKPKLTPEERQKNVKSYPAFSKERYELEEEFNAKYGRGWRLKWFLLIKNNTRY